MKPVDYRGSWVLVTGASSGIGAAFAQNLAHRGAHLILTARSRERLQSFASDLSKINGVEARVVPADLTLPEGVQTLFDGVAALGVPVEHVINNAGLGAVGSASQLDLDTQRRMLRLNIEALASITRHFLPGLLSKGRGGIIHVASTAAFQPTPYMAVYGASKAFVLSFSLATSEETRGTGTRVLALCPGPVPTGFQRAAGIPVVPLTKLVQLDAAGVVESALRAYDAGRPLVIPGVVNTLQTTASKLLPRGLIVRAARWTMRGLHRA